MALFVNFIIDQLYQERGQDKCEGSGQDDVDQPGGRVFVLHDQGTVKMLIDHQSQKDNAVQNDVNKELFAPEQDRGIDERPDEEILNAT